MNDEGGGASFTTEKAAGTSSGTDVSLDRFLSMRINHTNSNIKMMSGFVVVIGMFAWSQIQRRLELLNNENERLLAQQEKTVSQDTYSANEQQRKEEQHGFRSWQKEVDTDRTQSVSRDEFTRENKTDRRAQIGTGTAVLGGVVALIVIMGFAVQFLNYQALHNNKNNTTTITVPVAK